MVDMKSWFNEAFFQVLADQLHQQHKGFDRKSFLAEACDDLGTLALKARMHRAAVLTGQYLPESFIEALDILYPLAREYDGTFQGMFFPEFVGIYGKGDIESSLDALKYFTHYSSSEFAVREFLMIDLERTLETMTDWAKDDNHHVRRLASEGSRPRLPWSFQIRPLTQDPTPVKTILDTLKADPELYVRKSVANHLNDISKDHPDTMLDWVGCWDGEVAETGWIIKHASRSLLKQGHPRAFALFGFEADPDVDVPDLTLSQKSIALGDKLSFSFSVTSRKIRPQKLCIDYIVHYVKKSGKTAPKVFKLTEAVMPSGDVRKISKSQTFENFSTRTHYAGEHKIEIMINGLSVASASFELKII